MIHNALFAQRKFESPLARRKAMEKEKGSRTAGMMLLSLLLLLSVVLAGCGGSNSTTKKRPAHPNSLTLLANQQDAYTQNFNPYSPGVISGTQGLINETLLYVNRLDGSVKPWLASSTDPQVQRQALDGLQKIMVEQLPSIPLTAEPYWYEYSTAKFVGWPDEQHPYAAPGTAEYPDIEYVLLNLQPAQ